MPLDRTIDNGQPKTAVAYYRTRPQEPEASDRALRNQRSQLAGHVEATNLTAVGEFIEAEQDGCDVKRPVLVQAMRAAWGRHGDKLPPKHILLIASGSGIGSGKHFAFHEWLLRTRRKLREGAEFRNLMATLIDIPDEIPLPGGGPDGLSLYAEDRNDETLYFLCNPSPVTLTDVTVSAERVSRFEYCTSDHLAWEPDLEMHFEVIRPESCALVYSWPQWLNEDVRRLRIPFTDAARCRQNGTVIDSGMMWGGWRAVT